MNKLSPLLIFLLFSINSNAIHILHTENVSMFPVCVTPEAPGGLRATTISTSKISLVWIDNSTAEDGFTIERSSISGTTGFTSIGTVGSNVTAFTNFSLAVNKQYWYRVRAFCTSLFSPYSGVASSITLNLDVANVSRPEFKTGKVYQTINMASGAYFLNHTDLTVSAQPRPLVWQLFYNSRLAGYNHLMGFGWSHSYDYVLTNIGDSIWKVHYADGHETPFVPLADGSATPVFGGTFETLLKNVNKTYALTFKNQEVFLFDSTGKLTSITDRNGNMTTLSYSSVRLASVTAPGGRSLTFAYDASNRIIKVTDPLGRNVNYAYTSGNLTSYTDANTNTTKYTYSTLRQITRVTSAKGDTVIYNTYDAANKLISQSDAYLNATTFTYDLSPADTSTAFLPNGGTQKFIHDSMYRLLIEYNETGDSLVYTYDQDFNNRTITNEKGIRTIFTYDNRGNLILQNKPQGAVTGYTYNLKNDTTRITGALGNITTMNYDVNGNLLSVIDPLSNQKTFIYNLTGQLINTMDKLNQPASFTYNASGDLITTTTPAGTTTYAYDGSGNILTFTDPNGHITSYNYNNINQIVFVKDAASQNITYTYDKNNNLATSTDKKGSITNYTFDKKDRLVTIQDPTSATTVFRYDVQDNLTVITDPLGNVSTFSYDPKNKMNGSGNANGIKQFGYDAVGNLTSKTDETFYVTGYLYDSLSRLTTITDGVGNITKFTYDALNQKLTSEDPKNLITNYTYNANMLLTSVKDPTGSISVYTYDANGNRITEKDPAGHVTTYNFIPGDRISSIIDPIGNSSSFIYDAKGNMISKTDPNGTVALYTYDAINRLIKISYSTGDSNLYTYDGNNNLLTMSNATGLTSISYNKTNHPVVVTDAFGNRLNYTYNAGGLQSTVTYPGNRTVTYTYDGINALNQVTDWMGHITTYLYDNAGRIKTMTYPNGTRCNYVYDNAGRLKDINNKLAGNTIINRSVYTLDAGGYRVQEQRQEPLTTLLTPHINNYTYLNDNRLKKVDSITYNNDANGNRLSETGLNAALYTWTENNLLASVTRGTKAPFTFKYDPLGNRIQKRQGTNTKRYLLDYSMETFQILEEQDSSRNPKGTCIYGIGLIARIDSANNFSYYHFDGTGNTIALTDSSGLITNTYTYEPFGEMLNHNGNSDQPFLTGGRQGVTTEGNNIFYTGIGYYDAVTGRFISKSADWGLITNPQSLNRYLFAFNNPLSIIDKSVNFFRKYDNDNPRVFKKEIWFPKKINSAK
ncbi:MAG: hypothetical protein H7296_10305 [Bacteroidia bacterium]|nr:hypothetical protein [Bacteroidia bacterium]